MRVHDTARFLCSAVPEDRSHVQSDYILAGLFECLLACSVKVRMSDFEILDGVGGRDA